MDEGIAALIGHLAAAGCPTVFSCEDDHGNAYVLFDDPAGFERAVLSLAALAGFADDRDLRARVLQLPGSSMGNEWQYLVSVQTMEVRGRSSSSPGFDYVIRLPTADLASLDAMARRWPTNGPVPSEDVSS